MRAHIPDRRWSVFLVLTVALLAAGCGGTELSQISGPGEGEPEPLGNGSLRVEAVDYDFEVTTCDLDGYQNQGIDFDFDVAGVGSIAGRTYHLFARRSYDPENKYWIEAIDLDYQDGDEGLHALHGFSAAESEPFIFALTPVKVEVASPVAFVSDLVDETPAGQGTLVINCPAIAATIAPTTTAKTVTPKTATTNQAPTATTTIVTEPGAACQTYAAGLADLLSAAAGQLEYGAATSGDLAAGSLSLDDGVDRLSGVSRAFSDISDGLDALGDPPAPLASAAQLAGDSFELFGSSYDLQAQGAAHNDAALIDDGASLLDEGAALLRELPAAMGDCPATGTDAAGALAEPDETAVAVFLTTVEILLRDSAYEGLEPAVLIEGAQAPCQALAAGGDAGAAVAATLAATPASGQPFGNDERNLVLILTTRGVRLWCPDFVDDQEAFTDEVISTIVDVYLDG